jgi:hypothetical protein
MGSSGGFGAEPFQLAKILSSLGVIWRALISPITVTRLPSGRKFLLKYAITRSRLIFRIESGEGSTRARLSPG